MRWRFRPPQIIFTPLLAALLVIGGCAHLATQEEKQSSFKPFAAARVGREMLGDFLEARTAIVVAGAEPILITDRAQEMDVRLRSVGNGGVNIGSAAAISADGYFLTAAHCVAGEPLYLLYAYPGTPKIVKARLVWKYSDASDPFRDIAILKCDPSPEAAFEMADDRQFMVDSRVVTNGVNGLAGGSILRISSAATDSRGQQPQVRVIVHDAPLAEGDSGGPLTTLAGDLIGIEVLARGSILGHAQGIALRPDPKWLESQVAADRAGHPVTQP
jgi:S1-C subfamily serine protease